MSTDTIENLLRTGRWQRLQDGVYAAFTGAPSRDGALWAVVLRAGTGAALSHQTAAELWGLTDSRGERIHVTVPVTRHPVPIRGAVVHRAASIDQSRHPTLLPPRTRLEDTVIDLTQASASFDDALGWLSRGVGRRLTTPARLQAALEARRKVRWRSDLTAAVGDVAAGAQSVLEHRYVADVERRHGLPPGYRQARVVTGGRVRYVDSLYEDAGLAIELDGQAAHRTEDRWNDLHRDNAHAAAGLVTLRYSWADVTERPCLVAAQIADVLQQRGMPTRLRRCHPHCPVPQS